MGIQNRRFSKVINTIIQEELQKGNLPSSKEVLWRLNDYLRNHNLDRPNYNFQPIREGTIASSYMYNDGIDRVYEDIETLYENIIDINNDIMKNFNKFEVDKTKLEYELSTLENSLKEMILLYSKTGFLNSVYDVFDDMEKINASKSSINVDIKRHEVAIPDIKNTSKRIYPDGSTTFFLMDEIAKVVETINVSGKPSDALTDNMNDTWQQLIISKEKQEIAGYYSTSFKNTQMVNRIELSLHSVKPTFVRIEFTGDGMNWFGLPYYEKGVEVTDEFIFDFPSIEIKDLRFLLSKKEPDAETSDGNGIQYRYLIGAKHINMYQLDFSETGVLESTPLAVDVPTNQNFSISKVSLLVDEVLPNGTELDYYIALKPEDDTKDPEWKRISPINRETPKYDQIIDFKNITRAPAMKYMIDPNISITQYEMDNLYTNGIRFYKIGEVEGRKIISGTERLYVGRNSWGMKSFLGKFKDHATHVPKLEDWEKPINTPSYGYSAIQEGKPGLLLSNTKHTDATTYMYTLGLLSDKDKVVSAKPVSTEPIAVFLNGEKLFEGIPNSNTKINYLLKYGWNELVVLVYVRKPESANGATLDIGFDPREHATNVYSKAQPMEKISLHDLRFNTKNSARNKYAVMEAGEDKYYIIINHAVPGLQYDFLFNYVEGKPKQEILFKVDFFRDRNITNISPKLKSYRLRFS